MYTNRKRNQKVSASNEVSEIHSILKIKSSHHHATIPPKKIILISILITFSGVCDALVFMVEHLYQNR